MPSKVEIPQTEGGMLGPTSLRGGASIRAQRGKGLDGVDYASTGSARKGNIPSRVMLGRIQTKNSIEIRATKRALLTDEEKMQLIKSDHEREFSAFQQQLEDEQDAHRRNLEERKRAQKHKRDSVKASKGKTKVENRIKKELKTLESVEGEHEGGDDGAAEEKCVLRPTTAKKTPEELTRLLEEACIAGADLSLLKKLIATSGADINAPNKRGATALHHAVWWGHDDLVHTLVTGEGLHGQKADVAFRNSSGNTALHFAFRQNRLAIADFLISHGAEQCMTMRNGKGELPGELKPRMSCDECAHGKWGIFTNCESCAAAA